MILAAVCSASQGISVGNHPRVLETQRRRSCASIFAYSPRIRYRHGPRRPITLASMLHAFSTSRRHENLRRDQSAGSSYGQCSHRAAIGLLGPNGSGKTTMIRTLLGLIPVDNGTGEILGMDFRRQQLDIRTMVGFVPEDECLFPQVVGVEFVGYAGELVGMSTKDALQRA